jgi:hypothetical protein
MSLVTIVFLSPVADKKGPMSPVAKYPSEALSRAGKTTRKCIIIFSDPVLYCTSENGLINKEHVPQWPKETEG